MAIEHNAADLLPVAIEDLALISNQVNGFRTRKEKERAVRTLLVLEHHVAGGYSFTELERLAGQHGWSTEDVAELRRLAEHVSEGRSFRPAIRLAPSEGARIADALAAKLNSS